MKREARKQTNETAAKEDDGPTANKSKNKPPTAIRKRRNSGDLTVLVKEDSA
jgi:hypothetical protein